MFARREGLREGQCVFARREGLLEGQCVFARREGLREGSVCFRPTAYSANVDASLDWNMITADH